MKRILIITDDFNEVTFLETLLKKIGFDTLGVQSAHQAMEKMMVMNPDLILLADRLKGQFSAQLMENLISFRPQMSVVLMKRDLKSETGHSSEFVNRTIKSPIDPVELIRVICQVGKLKEDIFLEKYSKLGLFKGDVAQDAIKVSGKVDSQGSENKFVRGLNQTLSKVDNNRKQRLELAAKQMPEPKSKMFSHKEAVKEVKELRARGQDEEIKKIDEERKDFVRALFKKH